MADDVGVGFAPTVDGEFGSGCFRSAGFAKAQPAVNSMSAVSETTCRPATLNVLRIVLRIVAAPVEGMQAGSPVRCSRAHREHHHDERRSPRSTSRNYADVARRR